MEVRSGRLDSFSGEDLESARDVLISRFTVGKKSADHNRALIKRIFSGATFHCHRAGREVPTAGCSLALGEVGGRCVAVGCYRHVPAPRRSSLQGFTELLLLAVETEYERQGNGRAIVAVILRDSWRAGSARLLVVSTGHAFWKKPSLQLSELGSPTDVEQPVFAPWSAGISIVGREARACSEPRQRSPQPAPQRVGQGGEARRRGGECNPNHPRYAGGDEAQEAAPSRKAAAAKRAPATSTPRRPASQTAATQAPAARPAPVAARAAPSKPLAGSSGLRCRSCDAPGAQRREASNGGALCRACYGRWIAREYCPVCERLWSDVGDDACMLQCDSCDCWVHARCERLSPASVARWCDLCYSCPSCRDAAPGEQLPAPPRSAAVRPCFSCQAAPAVGEVEVPEHGAVPLCGHCQARWEGREYCPVCNQLWKEAADDDDEGGAEEDMVQCDACSLWVHTACESMAPDEARAEVSGARLTVWYEEEVGDQAVDVPYSGMVKRFDPRDGLYVKFAGFPEEFLITNEDDWQWGSHSAGVGAGGGHASCLCSAAGRTVTAAAAPAAAPVTPSASTSSSFDPALAERYKSHAVRFEPLTAANVESKMRGLCEGLEKVYGSMPFARKEWGTSILGTLVGLICAQTCRNSWSSIGYANFQATFPGPNGEPDWDLVRRSRVEALEPCIQHGPYYHTKAERIHGLLQKAYEDFGAGTSFEALHTWPSEKVRSYLMAISGLSGKSIACLLLYRMNRLSFAVDANVLRMMTRLGWLKSLGIMPVEGLAIGDRRVVARIGLLPAPPPRRAPAAAAATARRDSSTDVVAVGIAVERESGRIVLRLQPIPMPVRLQLCAKQPKPPRPALTFRPSGAGTKKRRCGAPALLPAPAHRSWPQAPPHAQLQAMAGMLQQPFLPAPTPPASPPPCDPLEDVTMDAAEGGATDEAEESISGGTADAAEVAMDLAEGSILDLTEEGEEGGMDAMEACEMGVDDRVLVRDVIAEAIGRLPSAPGVPSATRKPGVPLAFGFSPYDVSGKIGPEEPPQQAASSTDMTSDAWRAAPGSAALKVTGAPKMYCRVHSTYHVCDWTRQRAKEMAAAKAPKAAGGAASARASQSAHRRASGVGDIEDLPKHPQANIKRFSVRAQQFMREILPQDEDPPAEPSREKRELQTLLYRAHVYMITHGAILCGETPSCDQCPIRASCDPVAPTATVLNPADESASLTEALPAECGGRVSLSSAGAASGAEPLQEPPAGKDAAGIADGTVEDMPEDPGRAAPPRPSALPAGSPTEKELAELHKLARGEGDTHYQLRQARAVLDESIAPRHAGDATPRLLLVKSIVGEHACGRLLFSPWTAFKGIFPMHGTYFFQNEVFEDESAGEVHVPLASLGTSHPVYLGKSIEGVLRGRGSRELQLLFRHGYVCIRRFRTSSWRLLPLVLDPPRLLKYNALPSGVAVQIGLHTAAEAAAATSDGADVSPDPAEASRRAVARATGVRLFGLYVAAGGALCMRESVWRRVVLSIHPDRGGDVTTFQLLNDWKRLLDSGEELPREVAGEIERASDEGLAATAVALALKIESDLRSRAAELGLPPPALLKGPGVADGDADAVVGEASGVHTDMDSHSA
ncbi:hypothetical protein EMIHUDRAFT_451890 [Emiliania huxleyi CCMP1516]|uniref:PHD-type domain-containing protein n=2 Tax=Emiliania huxleyi TaxID=2903 RepID=A0A0D3IR77_EMIH1|nr:hypothetical protein EMIHUDRAFT_451890 [Emiliania huxleyi CCMP1516]EOD13762.1 hypothetical protein EMIHUDRAFT_451890 [Emiliania huxleyi CCMP1516]|eukprot:XP_005766191.1 hypothetical protein EMIHUDRAFT_451890 [Emiliania huxleyi CCMP1516]